MTLEGQLVLAAQGALLLLALRRGIADRITLTLLAYWAVTGAADAGAPFLAVADCAVSVAMLALWSAKTDMRAWSVGLIGWLKTGARLAFVSSPALNSTVYVVVIDAAFFAQIIVAGGVADGLGHRLDNLFLRFFPRRHKLLRNSET